MQVKDDLKDNNCLLSDLTNTIFDNDFRLSIASKVKGKGKVWK